MLLRTYAACLKIAMNAISPIRVCRLICKIVTFIVLSQTIVNKADAVAESSTKDTVTESNLEVNTRQDYITENQKYVPTEWHQLDSNSKKANDETKASLVNNTSDQSMNKNNDSANIGDADNKSATQNGSESAIVKTSANGHASMSGSFSNSEESTEAPKHNHTLENPAQVSETRATIKPAFQDDSSNVEDGLVFTELPSTMKTGTYKTVGLDHYAKAGVYKDNGNPDTVTAPTTQLPQTPNQLEMAMWSRIMSDDYSEPAVTGQPLTRDQIDSMLVSEALLVSKDAASRAKRQAADEEADFIQSGCPHANSRHIRNLKVTV